MLDSYLNTLIFDFKGLCHACSVQFVQNASYALLFAMKIEKLLVNDKITGLSQTNQCRIQPRTQACSRYPSDQKRLGTEFSRQA